jgi:hypothetical protein
MSRTRYSVHEAGIELIEEELAEGIDIVGTGDMELPIRHRVAQYLL